MMYYSAFPLSRSDLPQFGTVILFRNMNLRMLLEIITLLQENSISGCPKIRYRFFSFKVEYYFEYVCQKNLFLHSKSICG